MPQYSCGTDYQRVSFLNTVGEQEHMHLSSGFVEAIGFVAAACTTLSFVPQLIKIRRQGGRDLSYAMLSVYLFGLALWLAYGLLLHAPAVIAANIVGLILVGAALLLKIVMDRRMTAASEAASVPQRSPITRQDELRTGVEA
jgi:MtN3 and saliva related transmembrane protein